MAESEEELKSLLMKVKEESEKVGIKLNIQKTKIMASGPITSWQIDPYGRKDWRHHWLDGHEFEHAPGVGNGQESLACHSPQSQTWLRDWTDIWGYGSLWAHWAHSSHMHFSHLGPVLFPCSPCLLHPSSFSAITMGGGSTAGLQLGSSHSYLEVRNQW